MVSHLHLDKNNFNGEMVYNHKIVQLNTTAEVNSKSETRSSGNEYPNPSLHISPDNNIKTKSQENGLQSNSNSSYLGALKEWAVVCEAIESGDQILLFRKGGIMEYRSGFELKFKDFFLFPTFEHQARESVRPKYHAVFDEIEKNNDTKGTETTTTTLENNNNSSSASKEYTKVTSFVEITHFSEVPSLERLKALEDFHIWTDDYLKMRFNYNPKKPLHLLLLRAYKLKKPIQIMNKPQWIGCKSWIQIDSHDQDLELYFANNSISENPFEYLKTISNPCIDDDNFNKLSEKVRSII